MAYLTSQGYQPYSDPYFQDIGYGASGTQYVGQPMSYAQSGQPQGGAQIAKPPSSYQQLPDWAQKYYGSQMQGIDPGLSSYMQKQFYNDYQMHAKASPNMVDPITGIYTPWAIQQGMDPSALGSGQLLSGAPVNNFQPMDTSGIPGSMFGGIGTAVQSAADAYNSANMNHAGDFYTQQAVNPWTGAQQYQVGGYYSGHNSPGGPSVYNNNGQWTQMNPTAPGNSSTTTIGAGGSASTAWGFNGPDRGSGSALNYRY